jgi:hypothetical protein
MKLIDLEADLRFKKISAVVGASLSETSNPIVPQFRWLITINVQILLTFLRNYMVVIRFAI